MRLARIAEDGSIVSLVCSVLLLQESNNAKKVSYANVGSTGAGVSCTPVPETTARMTANSTRVNKTHYHSIQFTGCH